MTNPFDHHKYRLAASVAIENRAWPNRVIEKAPRWVSVDLRDGNQALIEPMNMHKKQQMWGLLVNMGFKEIDYAVEVCEAVLDVWQPGAYQACIINLPGTVEVSTPNLFADQVEYFSTHMKWRDHITLSVHTHNDRGGAVASSELALLAGAERVEGTLFGNGERTGNMDVITMAMNLYSQGIDPELDLSNPEEMMRVYSASTGLTVPPRHPWFGEIVYTAFSGSHQDAIRKCLHQQQQDEAWQVAYLPIDPRDIGRDYEAVIRVNSQSGKGGVAFLLNAITALYCRAGCR
ncbi:MAG: hypothetical protein Q9M17_04465 [Mariprofundus sp.]|nr:hypothetical protein [Mariprofundus sp.]